MLQQILIASQNQGKIREIHSLLAKNFPGLEVLSAGDFPETKDLDPEETGKTFAENAELKARAFARASGHKIPVLADDSGVIVPSLSSDPFQPFPGVHSARWHQGSDVERLQALLSLLAKKCPTSSSFSPSLRPNLDLQTAVLDPCRAAYYECVFCFFNPNNSTVHFFTGRCSGHFAFNPHGPNGFGYDPAFIPDGHVQTFGQLDPTIKNQISHRAQALQKFLASFQEKNNH